MEHDHSSSRRPEIVHSIRVRAGRRRTYFFDVRKTKGHDYYVTLTESTRKHHGDGFERHKIFLYKEDFNRFIDSLEEVINYVKEELMPDYDYDEFTRRHEEWEARKAEEEAQEQNSGNRHEAQEEDDEDEENFNVRDDIVEDEDEDMDW